MAIQKGEQDILEYRRRFIVAAKEANNFIVALFSTIALNTPPLSVNLVTNAMLRTIEPNAMRKIVVENHPMRNTEYSQVFKILQILQS